MLSIGSGSAASRWRQPWIDAMVFDPLRRRGVEVWHHELDAAPGVDIAGDLRDLRFLERLSTLGARSVLCANVLEHVAAPAVVAAAITAAVPPAGRVVVTVPRRYPYHPDPLDTMLRPSLPELAALFPALSLVDGQEVPCGSLVAYALSVRGKRTMLVNAVRAARQRTHGPSGEGPPPPSSSGASPWPFLVRSTVVTCASLVRTR
jgi:hypothetical protein